MYQITLTQVNAKNDVTFEASAKFSLEKDFYNEFAIETANFCKKTIDFVKRSKNRGVNINGIKKSQPINISIKSLEDNEVLFSLYFKNFGKFVENSSLEILTEQLQDSAEYVDSFNNWK